MDYFLQMKNVSKTFGEVAALRDVNFEVGTNEIVGLLGDNGAGKSTLVKIITGYHQPDPGGEIYWKGERIEHLTVAKARDLGIEIRCTRSGPWRTSSPCGATSSWAASWPTAGACWTFEDAPGNREADADRYGLHLLGGHARFGVKTFSGRRAPGRGDHAGPCISRPSSSSWTSRPWACRCRRPESAWTSWPGSRAPARRASSSTTTSSTSIPVADRIVVLDRGTVAGQFMKNELTLQELIERLLPGGPDGQPRLDRSGEGGDR